MKKTFLLIALAASVQQLLAQSVKLGIKVGLNESTAYLGQSIYMPSFLTGFNAGIFAEIKLNRVSVEPGVSFITAGYKDHTSVIMLDPTPLHVFNHGTVTLKYLQVPINVLYNIPLRSAKVFVGGGPYFAFALSGTNKLEGIDNGVTDDTDTSPITFGASDNFVRGDYGLNALAGVSIRSGLIFSLDYGYGLAEITNAAEGTIKNRVLSVSLGYEFL